MGPSHRQPPFLSDSRSQNLSQHIFYTMLRKTRSGFCTKQNPGGGLSVRACRAAERARDREAGCFSQKSRRASYYLQRFMWSKGLFLSSAKLVSLLFLQLRFVLLNITERLVLLLVMEIGASVNMKTTWCASE